MQQDTASIQRLVLLAILTLAMLLGAMLWALRTDNRARAVARLCRPLRWRSSHSISRPSARCSTPRCSSSSPRSSSACWPGSPTGCISARLPTGGRRMTASAQDPAGARHRGAGPDRRARRHGDRPRAAADVGARDHAADRVPSTRATSSAASTSGSATRSAAVPARLLEGPPPAPQIAPFYVVLEKKPDGGWAPRQGDPRAMPQRDLARPHRAQSALGLRLAGGQPRPNAVLGVRYGIESYFVPEGQGKRLEALAREKRMAAPDRRRRQRQRRHQGPHHRRRRCNTRSRFSELARRSAHAMKRAGCNRHQRERDAHDHQAPRAIENLFQGRRGQRLRVHRRHHRRRSFSRM